MKDILKYVVGVTNLIAEHKRLKESKKIGKLQKSLKEKPELLQSLRYYDWLVNSTLTNEAFLKDCIESFKKLDSKKLIRQSRHILGENYDISKVKLDRVDESVNYLISYEKNDRNLNKYYMYLDNISEHVARNKTLLESRSKLNRLKENINSQLKNFDSDDKQLIERVISTSNENANALYEDLKREYLSLLNEKINSEENLQLKVSLYEAKDAIANSTANESNYIDKIINLVRLKTNVLK